LGRLFLAGSRDTELAVSVHQPEHTVKEAGVPRGQIYGFRMSLWAEHLGAPCEAYERPHTLGCVHLVNAKARASWEAYCSEMVVELPHHLMSYPVHVDPEDGAVTHIHDHVTFPDFPSGWIEGKKSGTLPRILTT
jgi:phospholipase D1/2